MLVTMNEVLHDAKKGHYAVGLFNAVTLELAQGIINAAEETGSPVISSILSSPGFKISKFPRNLLLTVAFNLDLS